MDKLRVAVFLENSKPSEGGGHAYYQTIVGAIDRHSFPTDIELLYLNVYSNELAELQLRKRVIDVKKTFTGAIAFYTLNLAYRVFHRLLKSDFKSLLETISKGIDAINNQAALRYIKKENIHLVYYLKPQENVINYPMIITHWDVGHKSMYPFPEVAWDGNYKKREAYYQKILTRAFLILCESNAGAKELQYYYPVNLQKVKVLPIFGGDILKCQVSKEEQIKILDEYRLVRDNFYIYPAQFWSHKNHSTLIHAFHLLLKDKRNKAIRLVLCGSDQGNLTFIKNLIDTLGLNDNILLPGFVSNQHLYALYKNAIALVMPTFLGPTNIPLIEAAHLECAILCSDFDGHREILESNALYFDPSSASTINRCLAEMLNPEVREQLATAAFRHINKSSFQVERSLPLLDRFLQEIKPIREAWGMNFKILFAFAKIGMLSIN
ncbi:MAG: glycosyltransferase [Chitinophagaceae bacterium]